MTDEIMNNPIVETSPVVPPAFAGKIRIDIAQVTRVETDAEGRRHIRAGVISGWAIAPEPFARIEVILGKQRIARARIGRYRPDVAEIFPAIPHAEHTGFEVLLTRGELPEGPCPIILWAVTTSGKTYVKRYPLTGTETDDNSALVAMRTHVERCEIDSLGTLCVSGWAVARTPVISIQVFSGGRKVAGTLPGLPRPDVAEKFPTYSAAGRSGFFTTASLPAGSADVVTIEVLARDGALRRVVATPRRVDQIASQQSAATPRQEAVMSIAPPESGSEPDLPFYCDYIILDSNGRFQAAGWLVPSDQISRISVSHKGVRYGIATTGKPRPDVAKAYPNVPGSMQAGFELVTDLPGPLVGKQKVELVVEFDDDRTRCFEFEIEPVEADTQSDFQFHLGDAVLMAVDGMQIEGGHSRRPITGSFHLMGWAVARNGISRVEVYLDGTLLGLAYHGMRREDVGAAFPDHRNSLLGGFAFAISTRQLRTGRATFRLIAVDKSDQTAELTFTADVNISEGQDRHSQLRQKMPWAEAQIGLQIIAARGTIPVCHLLLRPDKRRHLFERAKASLDSISRQVWPEWRLWLTQATGVDTAALREELVNARPDLAERIDVLHSDVKPALSDFVNLMQAGDLMAVDGLLAPLLAVRADDRLVYSDDRRPDPQAPARLAAYRKPSWSPDLLLSQNYIGRAWLARADLLPDAGLALVKLAQIGDYAAILRLTATAGAPAIRHQPTLMLEAAGGAESSAAERRSLTTHLRTNGIANRVLPGATPFLHRVMREPAKSGTVSIIIPSIGAKGHIISCLESIRRNKSAFSIEIVVVDNLRRRGISSEGKAWKAWFRENADTVVEVDEPFNWSRLNNLGASAAKGDYLLFLNDDVEVISPDWLEVLVTEAARPEVGVVGAQLLYPDGKVQHAGMFLSRTEPGNFRHAFRFADSDDPCYFGLALSQRNLLCVTGACMMLRRDVFDAVNGFDEAHSVVNNDVDFCLRLHRSGRLVVYTPHAQLTHHELASRANLKDSFDRSAFLETWGDLCQTGDPYLNPAISTDADDYAPEEEPLREVYAGHPLGAREKVQRILAVKLDHIGDLVTALPAFRRLKVLFPHAHLSVLVGRSAMSIAAMEPAIDTLIPFEFFDARSGLGRKKLTKADYSALEADLKARQFDLAVDLRKLGDTRHILQHSGAPLLAGFDHNREFSWLDITLEWERDALQVDKRSHVATDLLNLVEAIGTAFVTDRRTIATPATALPPISDTLRAEFVDLFTHPYVVIHPAAGTPLRQWSPDNFARLIDLLADENEVRVALIGGPDEREIAARVMTKVRRQDRVFDLVGRSKLPELPRILAESVLFVGNNSGPSHIASGLGVPTVSIHSALVSSEEWGPMGPEAMALRRDMSCSPCYIVNVDQCHRAMSCLHGISPFAVYDVCRRFLDLRRTPPRS